jgi:signal transduction histidine kinase
MLTINALAGLFVIIQIGVVRPNALLWVWAAFMAVATGGLWLASHLVRQHLLDRAKVLYWHRLFTAGNLVLGLLWGGLVLWQVRPPLESDDVMIATVISALGATAAGTLFSQPAALFGLLLPALLTTALVFILLFTGSGQQLGAFLALLTGAYLYLARLSRSIETSTQGLSFDNLELVSLLRDEKRVADRARSVAEQAKMEAEEANVAKSKFLAAASHDLRQPLHAMGLLIHSLEQRIQEPEQLALLVQVQHAHDAMTNLFSALLDISKLDARVIDVQVRPFRLTSVLEELNDELAPIANERGLELSFSYDDYAVSSDPLLLARILRNLIHNALVHTQAGAVRIRCSETINAVQVSVTDTGPGIPEEELTNIFAEFHQLDNSARDRSKGLGLGLAIVTRLCGLLGHDLHYESKLGEGSRFSVTVAKAPAGAVLGEMGAAFERASSLVADDVVGSILVIDDERDILDAMRTLLASWSYEVVTAASVDEALEALNGGFEPDLAICDFRLQDDRTGVDALGMISRQLGRVLPALLVSGDTAPERIKEAHDSGYSLLHKPVQPARLRNALKRLGREIAA